MLIEEVQVFKYLGVLISNDLKWNTHIKFIISKVNSLLGLIKHSLRSASNEIKLHAYKTICRPTLEYACAV